MSEATNELNPFERDLARALNGYLGPRRAVDARAVSRAAILSESRARSAWRWPVAGAQGLAWLALVGLTLVALLALAIGVGQNQLRPTNAPHSSMPSSNPALVAPVASPTPQPSTALALTPSPKASQILTTASYLPVVTRFSADGTTLSVIVIATDGTERVVRSLTGDQFKNAHHGATLSTFGWLHFESARAHDYEELFIDLSNPDLPPVTRTGSLEQGAQAWGPTGLMTTDNGITFIDPGTQTTYAPTQVVSWGDGSALVWSAEGLGVFSNSPLGLGIDPVDGSSFQLGLRRDWNLLGSRNIGRNHNVLCSAAGQFHLNNTGCASAPSGVVNWSDALTDPWSSMPAGLRFTPDAMSFAADGDAIWAVARDGEQAELLSSSGEVVARIPPSVPPFDASAGLYFAGLAPDDSGFVIASAEGTPDGPYVYVTRNGTVHNLSFGRLAGWAPASMAAAWPTIP